MHRFGEFSCRKFSALAMLVVAAVGCSGDEDAKGEGRTGATLGPRTHVVSPEILPTVTVEDDRLTLPADAAATEGWRAGDILAGDFVEDSPRNPYGFLRRVRSIEVVDGSAIIHTTSASLADAIAQGSLHETFSLTSPKGKRSSLRSTGSVGVVPQKLEIGDRVSVGLGGKQAGKIEIPFEKPKFQVVGEFGVTDFSAGLAADVNLDMEVDDFSVQSARLVLNTDMVFDFQPFVGFGIEWTSPKTDIRSGLDLLSLISTAKPAPFEYTSPKAHFWPHTFLFGGLPVVVTGVGELSVSCGVEASAELKAGADLTFSAKGSAGISYADGTSTPILDGSVEHAAKPSFSASAGGGASCQLDIKLGLEFYGTATVYGVITPHAEIATNVVSECSGDQFKPEVAGQINLTYGAHTSVSFEPSGIIERLGFELGKIEIPVKEFDSEPLLLGGAASAQVDHCPCGMLDQPCCDQNIVVGPACDALLECDSNSQQCHMLADGIEDGSVDAQPGDAGVSAGDADAQPGDAGDAGPDDAATSDAGDEPDAVDGTRSDQTGAPQVNYDGVVIGDPHLRTLDGVRYDSQPVGELELLESTDEEFEIQLRTKPYGTSHTVAVISAAAVRVGGDRFSVYVDGTTRINADISVFAQGKTVLSGGVELFRDRSVYVLVWPDTSQIRFRNHGSYLGVEVHLAASRAEAVHGLLGDFDGVAAGDLKVRGGPALPDAPPFAYFYGVFVESWRIAQADSLFYYRAGEDTGTFTDRSFPAMPATQNGLDGSIRAAAAQVCEQARVSAEWLDACVIDVGYTSDPNFANDFVGLPAPLTTLTVRPDPESGSGGSGVLNPSDSDSYGTAIGTLAPGSTASYTIVLSSGQSVFTRLVDTNNTAFVPRVVLSNSEASVVAQDSGPLVAAFTYTATTAGSFTLVVSDASAGQNVTADYNLYYVVAPAAAEGGTVAAGSATAGTIDLGDVDSYTFSASAGAGVQIRVADLAGGAFVPAVTVYRPDGAAVLTNSGAVVAGGSFIAPIAGSYTIVVYDYSSGFASIGDYKLYLTLAPGANEHGVLAAADARTGTVDRGDLDSYTFNAEAGQGVQIRVNDVASSAFVPAVAVYRPDGVAALSNSGAEVAGGSFSAPIAGTYTIVVFDYSSGFASSGDYQLYLTVAPGANEHGQLAAADARTGTIDKGDLDSYTFNSEAGQGVQIRISDVASSAFVPAVAVYRPDGVAALSDSGAEVAGGSFSAPIAGTYTVVVYDYSSGFAASGDYQLNVTVAPGANEHGQLAAADARTGTIDKGDLDSYTFNAEAGQGVQIRVNDVASSAFVPAVAVYRPDGVAALSNSSAEVAGGSFSAPIAGTYTVVVYDYSSGFAASGDYQLYVTVAPGANENGELASGVATTGTIDKGDLDSYTFAGKAGTAQVQLTETADSAFVPAVAVYGPSGTVVLSNSGAMAAGGSFNIPSDATYTVVVYDYSSGFASSGSYQVLYMGGN